MNPIEDTGEVHSLCQPACISKGFKAQTVCHWSSGHELEREAKSDANLGINRLTLQSDST